MNAVITISNVALRHFKKKNCDVSSRDFVNIRILLAQKLGHNSSLSNQNGQPWKIKIGDLEAAFRQTYGNDGEVYTGLPYRLGDPQAGNEILQSTLMFDKNGAELLAVYNSSPQGVKNIGNHLMDCMDPAWRASFFVGPPGTGKTTAMIAIPFYAGWYARFISAPKLLSSYRNQTKEKLELELNDILRESVEKRHKMVVLIDEINRLLENFADSHYDSDATASFLWTFLDDQIKNKNFFLIGTMNKADRLPDPLKHRFAGSSVDFSSQQTPTRLIPILKEIFQRNAKLIFIGSACDDEEYLTACFSTFREECHCDVTPRDFENIRIQVSQYANVGNSKEPVMIERNHFDKALETVVHMYKIFQVGQPQLTRDEKEDLKFLQGKIIDAYSQGYGHSQTDEQLGPEFLRIINQGLEKCLRPDQKQLIRGSMNINDGQPLIDSSLSLCAAASASSSNK